MIAFVFKRGSKFSGKIRMPWETGAPRVVALETTDRREASRALDDLLKERFMEHRGEVTPRTMREAAQKPLKELLEVFLGDRRAGGKSEATLSKYDSNIRTLAAACGWVKLGDVSLGTFVAWWRKCEGSPKSRNDKRANMLNFLRWLVRQRLLERNPLEDSERDSRPVERFRRALSEDEQRRFLAAAPRFRSVVYLLILETGMRRREVNELRVGDLVLDTPAPFVRLPASRTKNRKEAFMRLRPHVVAAVRSILPPNPLPSEWVFHNRVPRISTIARDLRRAGIEFENDHGRIDLHALRVTFCTNLLTRGVHPREAQELMRHSEIRLTMKNYTDPTQLRTAEALEKLPVLEASTVEKERIHFCAHEAPPDRQDGARMVSGGHGRKILQSL